MEASTIGQQSENSLEIRGLYANEDGWLRSIPEEFRKIELKNCSDLPDGYVKFGLECLERDKFPSLYLFGQWGSGKTTFAMALIRELMRKTKRYFWPRYFTARVLDARLLNASRNEYGDEEELKNMASEDLLFIDDIDKLSPTPRFKSQFFEIINRRMLGEKPTIITSNLPPQDLSEILDGAVLSRMNDATKWEIIKFPSKDIRTLKVRSF